MNGPDALEHDPHDPAEASEFDALLNAAVDAVVVIDDAGHILRFNQAAVTMFGYSAAEVLGRPLALLMAPDMARGHQGFVERYKRTGRQNIIGFGREVAARRRDGSLFPATLSVGEAHSPRGRRFVGLIRDLTAQKEAEEETLRHRDQMLHASRLTTMGEMAAAIAHEINQPLSAIATYTAACQRLLDQGPDARDDIIAALREIGGQAHRAGQIIQRMRNFTRSRETHRRLVAFDEMLEEIRPLAELDARANRVELRIVIAPDLPLVNVDGVQIQQVILNLLRNGVDAMADIPEADRLLSLQATLTDDDELQVEISDRGPGVTERAREGLFTPFFTTKVTGMGMGLAISRSIITAHGGKLDYMNNSDVGATFYFTLPAALEK
ncbi:MAG: PAS domain S-box protein [Gammaproteobacteria bacterium]|nr:PAS domain S-box protein [Gammaproteobacteria bacterium]